MINLDQFNHFTERENARAVIQTYSDLDTLWASFKHYSHNVLHLADELLCRIITLQNDVHMACKSRVNKPFSVNMYTCFDLAVQRNHRSCLYWYIDNVTLFNLDFARTLDRLDPVYLTRLMKIRFKMFCFWASFVDFALWVNLYNIEFRVKDQEPIWTDEQWLEFLVKQNADFTLMFDVFSMTQICGSFVSRGYFLSFKYILTKMYDKYTVVLQKEFWDFLSREINTYHKTFTDYLQLERIKIEFTGKAAIAPGVADRIQVSLVCREFWPRDDKIVQFFGVLRKHGFKLAQADPYDSRICTFRRHERFFTRSMYRTQFQMLNLITLCSRHDPVFWGQFPKEILCTISRFF